MQLSALDTYKKSEIFKKSSNGFDTSAYKAWKECFEMWVIPLAIDVSNGDEENRLLKDELSKFTNKK